MMIAAVFATGVYVGIGCCFAAREAFYALLGSDTKAFVASPMYVVLWPMQVWSMFQLAWRILRQCDVQNQTRN